MTNSKLVNSSRNDNSLSTPNTPGAALEKVVLQGDLSTLTSVERLQYNNALCESLGLNPLTKPIDYIRQGNNLSAFVNSQGMAQLRKIHKVSIAISDRRFLEQDTYQVIAIASTRDGRSEEASAVVSLTYAKTGSKLKGQERANKMMATETKAKRRATLGLLGLPLLENDSYGNVEKSSTYDPPQDVLDTYRHNPKNIKEIRRISASAPVGLCSDRSCVEEARITPSQRIIGAYNDYKWNELAWKLMLEEWFQVDKTADVKDINKLITVATNQGDRDGYVAKAAALSTAEGGQPQALPFQGRERSTQNYR